MLSSSHEQHAFAIQRAPDSDLLSRVREAARAERHATATLIALLIEVDARRLYLGEGYSSLFTFCTKALHLSEHAAYGRIEAARAARKFPAVLGRLRTGALTLTSVCLPAPHLTDANHVELLDRAAHQPKREVEQIVAQLAPKVDVSASIRRLPTASPRLEFIAAPIVDACENTAVAVPQMRARIEALAPERFKLQFTIGRETHDKLRRVQDLLRHSIPGGDLEAIFDRALTLLLEHAERTKFAATKHPRRCRDARSATRYVPAAVKRRVWARDGGRCAFVGGSGRCTETAFLEYHHVTAFAQGGSTSEDNLELRCRAHNAYEEAQRFADVPGSGDV